MPARTRLRALDAPLRCATCHGVLDASPHVCERCGTRLHEDCRAELGACPTLGCAPRRTRSREPDPGAAGAPLWLYPEAWVVAALVGLGLLAAAALVQGAADARCLFDHDACERGVPEAFAVATVLGAPGLFLVVAAAIGLPVALESGA